MRCLNFGESAGRLFTSSALTHQLTGLRGKPVKGYFWRYFRSNVAGVWMFTPLMRAQTVYVPTPSR